MRFSRIQRLGPVNTVFVLPSPAVVVFVFAICCTAMRFFAALRQHNTIKSRMRCRPPNPSVLNVSATMGFIQPCFSFNHAFHSTIIMLSFNHGFHSTMPFIQPWVSFNHGFRSTMGFVQPWFHSTITMLSFDHAFIQPWVSFNHAFHSTKVFIQPWASFNNGIHSTMGFIQPWASFNHGFHSAMGAICGRRYIKNVYEAFSSRERS